MSDKNNSTIRNKPNNNDRQMGPGGFGAPVQKAKNFKGTLKRLIAYLNPHKVQLIIVLIFAIASTTFTIVAPKVTSKAMNKLQDAYMAQKVLTEMDKGQVTAINETYEKMAEAQTKAVDKISESMEKGQNEAVDKITEQMGDAQTDAVKQINKQMSSAQVEGLDGIVSGFYTGMVDGQKKAVNGICTQMGKTQKELIAQFTSMMQAGATVQAVDPALQKSIQDLMKLPLIDSIKNENKKIETTLKFVDILIDMPAIPGAPTADTKQLKVIKQLLELPLLNEVSKLDRVGVIKSFLNISKKLSQGKTPNSASSGMTFGTEAMTRIYSRIPSVSYKSSGSQSSVDSSEGTTQAVEDLLKLPLISSVKNVNDKNKITVKLLDVFKRMPMPDTGSNEFDAKTLGTLQNLLKLPVISTIKDPDKKLDNTLKLISIFQKMPEMKGSSKAKDSKIDPKDLDVVKKLLSLPDIKSIKDPQEKVKAIDKMVDLFDQMPEMNDSTSKSETTFDKTELANVKELLGLPKLATITDAQEKSAVLNKMLDVFSDMPKTETETDADTEQINPEGIKNIKAFLNLPRISTLTTAEEKANVTKQAMDLGKEMEKTMDNAPQGAGSDIKLTDDQVVGVIKAIRETNGKYDFNYIGLIALILIAMYLLSALFSLVMGLVMSGVAQKTVLDLRSGVDAKLSRLPLKYFDAHPHGDILSRVTNDVDTIATTLQQSLTQLITSIIQIVGFIIMMLTISPILTLIVVGTLPLYILSTAVIAKKSQKFFAAQQKELGELSGHVEEMYTGHKIVKAFGHETKSIAKFEGINEKLNSAGWKAQFVSGTMFPLMNFISNIGYVLISIVGGLWITKNLLKLGDILAFIQYSRSFTMPIVQTANIANVIQSTVACAERVFEILDEEEEIPESLNAIAITSPKGEVTFEQVDFRYKEDVPLISNMNLDVKNGHTVAIVGPTGAGKTTLVNLLMRFYEINAGKISIDGNDIREIKRSDLRKMFGMVLQDTWLFNGTIKENIAYGKEGATMEEITIAAKAAHANHFIRTLPEGYDTILNEEATNISQGQKQLITIARAILADPTILILDEATSSVDTRTEVLIQKAMSNLMKDRTSFVIAHRLSTIRDAESILVMDKGSIIEMGSHLELLEKRGFYYDLYNSQFSGSEAEAV